VQARGARPYKGPGQGALEGTPSPSTPHDGPCTRLWRTLVAGQGLVRRLHQVPRAIQRFRKLPMLARSGGAGRLADSVKRNKGERIEGITAVRSLRHTVSHGYCMCTKSVRSSKTGDMVRAGVPKVQEGRNPRRASRRSRQGGSLRVGNAESAASTGNVSSRGRLRPCLAARALLPPKGS
jgi:hypothetical protein